MSLELTNDINQKDIPGTTFFLKPEDLWPKGKPVWSRPKYGHRVILVPSSSLTTQPISMPMNLDKKGIRVCCLLWNLPMQLTLLCRASMKTSWPPISTALSCTSTARKKWNSSQCPTTNWNRRPTNSYAEGYFVDVFAADPLPPKPIRSRVYIINTDP